jgi:hypothetical protein
MSYDDEIQRLMEIECITDGKSRKRTSTQRFDKAPKLDGGLGSGTVAVIAIPLAFRRAAACALHSAHPPASHR